MAARNTQRYILGAKAPGEPTDNKMFRPKVPKGKVAKFVLRFIPPPETDDPALVPSFYVTRLTHFIGSEKDKLTKLCRKNLGKREKCPYCDYGFSPQGKESKLIRWAQRYIANVYVEKASEDYADLVGKVFLMEFGNQIQDKIMAEISPEADEFNPNPVPVNILDEKTGKSFIYCVDNSGSFPDYKSSKFAPAPSPLGDAKKVDEVFGKAYSLIPFLPEVESLSEAQKTLDDYFGGENKRVEAVQAAETRFERNTAGVSSVLDQIPDGQLDSVGGKPGDDWFTGK